MVRVYSFYFVTPTESLLFQRPYHVYFKRSQSSRRAAFLTSLHRRAECNLLWYDGEKAENVAAWECETAHTQKNTWTRNRYCGLDVGLRGVTHYLPAWGMVDWLTKKSPLVWSKTTWRSCFTSVGPEMLGSVEPLLLKSGRRKSFTAKESETPDECRGVLLMIVGL